VGWQKLSMKIILLRSENGKECAPPTYFVSVKNSCKICKKTLFCLVLLL